jgi:hypothetical protein
MSPFLVLPRVLAKPLRWPMDSARQARHNAYAAAAALAVRRAEREDVDRFLSERSAGEPGPDGRRLADPAPAGQDAVDPAAPVPSSYAISVPPPRTERVRAGR